MMDKYNYVTKFSFDKFSSLVSEQLLSFFFFVTGTFFHNLSMLQQ